MGILSDLYNKTFYRFRTQTTSATASDVASTTSTGTCLIRVISDKAQLFNESNWGKEYKMWTDQQDIKSGDIITIDSVKYGIVGIPEYIDLVDGSENHLEVRIYKK